MRKILNILRIYLQFPPCSPSFETKKKCHMMGKSSKCSAILTSFSLTPLSAFLASLYISSLKKSILSNELIDRVCKGFNNSTEFSTPEYFLGFFDLRLDSKGFEFDVLLLVHQNHSISD